MLDGTGRSRPRKRRQRIYLAVDSIEVTRLSLVLKKDRLMLSYKAIYRVDGCGQHLFYVCEGWDNYEQKALCEPTANAN
jgi:hypothetical protein